MSQTNMMTHYYHLPAQQASSHISSYPHLIADGLFFVFVFCIVSMTFLSSSSTLFLFSFNSWHVNVDIIGFIIPMLLCLYLIGKTRIEISSVLFGITAVTIMSFFVTTPVVEKGIVSSFPFSLFPAIIGAMISLLIISPERKIHRFVYSYCISAIGVFIGADLFHIPSLLFHQPNTPMNAIIGGAGLLDLIFISGIISCLVLLTSILANNILESLTHGKFSSVKT